MWRLLAMSLGVLPTLAMHSELDSLEDSSHSTARSTLAFYFFPFTLLLCTVYLTLATIGLSLSTAAIIARSIPGWLGLALIGGRVLGWRLSWVFPAGATCFLVYWGGNGPGVYSWWEFSARPYNDLPAAIVSLLLLLIGILAYWVTPWRVYALRNFIDTRR
jgi:hypothetical protein